VAAVVLLATFVESVGEEVASETGEAVVVGDVAVTEGEVVAEVKLSGVGDAVAMGDGEAVRDGEVVVVGDVAVVELGVVVDAKLSGLGEVVAMVLGEEVGVEPRAGEGLTVGMGEGDKVAIGLGDKVGEGVVMGVTVSAAEVDVVAVTSEGDSVVSASWLVVDVGFKTNDPTKVAIITPHKPNNIPVFIAGDISSDGIGGAGSGA